MLKNITRFTAHALSTCAVISACIGMSTAAHALAFKQISQLYFFGDSLTDSGFNDLWPTEGSPPAFPPLQPGKAPTFTSFGGYTWSQYVARDIKGFTLPIYPGPVPADMLTNNAIYAVPPPELPAGFVSGTLAGFNYAAGGSTTNSTGYGEPWAPSLHQQVAFFLSTAGAKLDPNAVYFIWSGANDILTALSSGTPPTQAQLLAVANTATKNIANEVALLSSRGAKRIVVLSLPNLGLTPLATELSASIPGFPATIKTFSFTFNSMLNTYLGEVIARYGTKILYIDTYTLLNQVVTATKAHQPYVVAGQSFQFANATDMACAPAPIAVYCPSTAPTNYVFADSVHPTGMTHRVLSLAVEQQILNWQ